MSYLQRRIEFLLEKIRDGSLLFDPVFSSGDSGKQLIHEIAQIARLADGSIDLSSCSPAVRAVAKAVFYLNRNPSDNPHRPAPTSPASISVDQVSNAMREYFQVLEDFFIQVTGSRAEQFNLDGYRSSVLQDPERKATRAYAAWQEYVPKIGDFHARNTQLLLGCGRAIGGLKCV